MRSLSPRLIHSLAGGLISALLYILAATLFYVGFRLTGALGWLGIFMSGPGLLIALLLNPRTDQALANSVIFGVSILFYFMEGFLLTNCVKRLWLCVLIWVVITAVVTFLGFILSIAALAGSSP